MQEGLNVNLNHFLLQNSLNICWLLLLYCPSGAIPSPWCSLAFSAPLNLQGMKACSSHSYSQVCLSVRPLLYVTLITPHTV